VASRSILSDLCMLARFTGPKEGCVGGVTIVSRLSVVYGDMVSTEGVDVSGKVVGNVRCDHFVLRRGGSVQGDVVANTAVIDGLVKGSVSAKQMTLCGHTMVDGSLIYNNIKIEKGAQIVGQLATAQEGFLEAGGQKELIEGEASS
jgi:cytoskeletal protein CcmA (bactofilin family)